MMLAQGEEQESGTATIEAPVVALVQRAPQVLSSCTQASEAVAAWEASVNPAKANPDLADGLAEVWNLVGEACKTHGKNKDCVAKLGDLFAKVSQSIQEVSERQSTTNVFETYPFAAVLGAMASTKAFLQCWVRVANMVELCPTLDNLEAQRNELARILEQGPPSLEDVRKLKKELKHLQQNENKNEKDLAKAEQKHNEARSSKAQDALDGVKRELQGTCLVLENMRFSILQDLNTHFPELCHTKEYKEVHNLGDIDHQEEICIYLRSEYFPVAKWPVGTSPLLPTTGSTTLRSFQGTLCVLREFRVVETGNVSASRRKLLLYFKNRAALRHPHLAKITRVFFDSSTSRGGFQVPFYEGGSLLHWVKRANHTAPRTPTDDSSVALVDSTSLQACLFYLLPLLQVLEALAYLHKNGVVHGDVRLEHILMTSDGVAVLSYFGIQGTQHDLGDEGRQQQQHTARDTIFLAPELLSSDSTGASSLTPFTPKSDMYAFGVCCLLLLTGWYPPVPAPEETTPLAAHLSKPSDIAALLDAVSSANEALGSILRSLVARDPQDRPEAASVMGHPVFRQAATNAVVARAAGRSEMSLSPRGIYLAPSSEMPAVTLELAHSMQSSAQGNIVGNVEMYLPYVVLCFAADHRAGVDTAGNGPGMYFASVGLSSLACSHTVA